MAFDAIWSPRLNCFLSQSVYALNLSNFFTWNNRMRPSIRAMYIDCNLSKISEYELSRNIYLDVHRCLEEFFREIGGLHAPVLNSCYPHLIRQFWIWARVEGQCMAQNSSRVQFYDPRGRMKLDSATGGQRLYKLRCATERAIASETSIISCSSRLNLLLFQQSWWLGRWYFRL